MPPARTFVGWQGRFALAPLLCALPLLVSGCYAGAAGIVAGILSISGPDSGRGSRPAVTFLAVEGSRKSPATIVFELTDAQSDKVDVELLYTELGVARSIATLEGERSLLGLETLPDGKRHQRRWEFAGQRGAAYHKEVTVTVRIRGSGSTRDVLVPLGNDPPVVASASHQIAAGADAVVGIAQVEVLTSDSSGDRVSFLVERRITGQDDWDLATPAGKSLAACLECLQQPGRGHEDCSECFAIRDAQLEAAGMPLLFFWDVVRDLGRRRLDVQLRFTPWDGVDWGLPVESAPFTVDNNGDPQVTLVSAGSLSDRAFEIPVRFRVRDDEGSPVAVILQWAPENEDFPELPRPGSPGTAGDKHILSRGYLQRLLEGDAQADVAERRRLQVLSEAAFTYEGTLDEADAEGRWIREADLVRHGLVFAPPEAERPSALPPAPFEDGAPVFLLGQAIDFHRPGSAGARGGIVGSSRIAAFDPRRSRAALAPPVPGLRAGLPFQVRARSRLLDLPSSPEGFHYTFLWSSLADIGVSDPRLELTARLKVKAVAVDSEVGPPSISPPFDLDDAPLTLAQELVLDQDVEQIEIADANGDGQDDILAARGAARTLKVYSRTEAGLRFPPQPTYEVELDGGPLLLLATGDLDRDGFADAVVTAEAQGADQGPMVHVLHQREVQEGASAQRRLVPSPAAPLFAAGTKLEVMAVGDIAGDAAPELIAGSAGESALVVFTYVAGVFAPPGERLELDKPAAALLVSDVDGDMLGDLVAGAGLQGASTVHLFLRARGGQRIVAEAGQGPPSIAVGRLGEAPERIVAVACRDSTTLRIFSARLEPKDALSIDLGATGLVFADADSDGADDLLFVAHGSSGSTSVYVQRGGILPRQPTFRLRLGAGIDALSVAAADLSNDDLTDLLVLGRAVLSSSTAHVFRQSAPGTVSFHRPVLLETGQGPLALAIGDLDGDGRADVAAATGSPGAVAIYHQTELGGLPSEPDLVLEDPGIGTPTDDRTDILAAGDLDGDGRIDLAVGHPDAGEVLLYLQEDRSKAAGDLSPGQALAAGATGITSVKIADFDGDGLNDLAAAAKGSLRVQLLGLSGDPARPVDVPVRDPVLLAAADLNADGLQDLLAAGKGTRDAQAYSFIEGAFTAVGPRIFFLGEPRVVTTGDLDFDGRSDLLAVADAPFGALVYRQADAGLPAQPNGTLFVGSNSRLAAIADLNGDSRKDVVASTIEFRLAIFYQDSSGELGLAAGDPKRRSPNQRPDVSAVFSRAVAGGDVNGDGREDLVGILRASNLLSVHFAR
ncbi:MAG: VCBS repeat-containing protein [Planctomycetes bacterium]|nr:VCBS repeat-containing protein [Planctomycetota bacterium]